VRRAVLARSVLMKQESVRPRWPYDMQPSVSAEKYIRDDSGWRKDVTDGNDNGTDRQTDRRTDRVRRNMRPPPREEGRIKNAQRDANTARWL